MKGKPLNSQSQALVLSLLNYFQREKDHGGPLTPLSFVQKRVSEALNISVSTITRIQNRLESNNNVLKSPGKKRHKKKPKTDLTDSKKCDVRDMIYRMYSEKKHITLSSLNDELKEKSIINIGRTSLHSLLPSLGFKYKKDDNRRFLIEKTNIALQRTKFLRSYINNLKTGLRKVIFIDETWIFAKGNPKKSWQDSSTKSVKRQLGFEGKRFIVVHAGSETGFIQNASLVFSSKSNTGDYHGDMNNEIFIRWLKEKLLCNLEEPCLIIMDNAPYHSILKEKNPNTSFKKQEIVNWLKDKEIPFDTSLTKLELLQITKQYAEEKKYVVDDLIREQGHEVLRTPPYQCEFNAIELIWANAKQYYDKHIGRDGHSDQNVFDMWEEALQQITPDTWKNCINHTNKIIYDWFDKIISEEVEPLIIQVNNEAESDSDFSDPDSNEDC